MEFAFDASLSESRSYDYTVQAVQLFTGVLGGEFFRVDIVQGEFAVHVSGCLEQALVYGFVSVLQFNVFTH